MTSKKLLSGTERVNHLCMCHTGVEEVSFLQLPKNLLPQPLLNTHYSHDARAVLLPQVSIGSPTRTYGLLALLQGELGLLQKEQLQHKTTRFDGVFSR